ncbi:MAG: cobalt-precorrin-6A reductase [Leptolyngbyaceae bacterium]|nr:cobalt-precorrin-6A reductase [Leptolyngbyaceae bacterium]
MIQPHPGRIWLIGGTQESAQLAIAISQAQLPGIISVTTEAARGLYTATPELPVRVGKLDVAELLQFLSASSIAAILDASHPYAVEISRLAIAAADQLQIPYLRYERPELETTSTDPAIYLDSFATLLAGDYLKGQRVLLTLGYRSLPLFQAWQNQAILFARILPSLDALSAALDAGFTSDRLIALRPPISLELERALWQQWQITLVVTKASGTAGGEDIKRQLAAELGVTLVIITRPLIHYPQQTRDLAIALEFCHQVKLKG